MEVRKYEKDMLNLVQESISSNIVKFTIIDNS